MNTLTISGAVAALLLSTQPAAAIELHLDCSGTGSVALHRGFDRSFSDQVKVDITDSASRIRLPRQLLPKFHGGENGWLNLRDIVATDSELTASAAMNFANHPKVRIDRIAGTISIDSREGTYAGKCQAYDPATVQRAF